MKWYRLLPSITTLVECSINSFVSCGLHLTKVVSLRIPIFHCIVVAAVVVMVMLSGNEKFHWKLQWISECKITMNIKFNVVYGEQRNKHNICKHWRLLWITNAFIIIHIFNGILVSLTLYNIKYCFTCFSCFQSPFSKLSINHLHLQRIQFLFHAYMCFACLYFLQLK